MDVDITKRKQAEQALREAHDALEERVHTRTAELIETNARLKEEMVERERVEARERQMVNELAHAGRFTMMGELASGLAHELNQPLTAGLAFAQACLRMLRGKPEFVEFEEPLSVVRDQIIRAGEIIKRLRAFVRRRPSTWILADVDSLLREPLHLLNSEIRLANVRVHFQIQSDLPSVRVDAIQILQVVLNLVRNAIEAMEQTPTDQRDLTLSARLDMGRIVVSVTDSGAGVDPKIAPVLFHPFQTTKPTGLGLGLAIASSIITVHGGTMMAEMNVDRGMTFSFTLPVTTL
jgi:two-component system sensor kinase FixL